APAWTALLAKRSPKIEMRPPLATLGEKSAPLVMASIRGLPKPLSKAAGNSRIPALEVEMMRPSRSVVRVELKTLCGVLADGGSAIRVEPVTNLALFGLIRCNTPESTAEVGRIERMPLPSGANV